MQNFDAYVSKADGIQIRVCSTSGAMDEELKKWALYLIQHFLCMLKTP